MGQLLLEVRDLEGPLRWRWLLSDERTGAPLADHQVDLAGAPGEFAAFADLYRYLRHYAVPDRRTASETEIAARVGAWAGEAVLGRAVCDAIVAAAPVTVRVVVPEQAGFVLSWPLELAHAGGQPLAARGDVTLAYDLAPDPAGRGPGGGPGTGAGGGGLRMLAVFSLPTATSVLALRRERFELARLVRRIAARQRRRVELTVVQYGATRERLAAVAEAGDGWDVLHLSGHGGRGQFLLENADGSPDPVATGEIVALLAPLRGRVRLAVVSACESAAATTAETLRWVGLEEQAQQFEQQAEQDIGATSGAGTGSGTAPMLTGVARAVAGRLGCAVVAMRYPVVDDFAIAFAQELYERLLGVRDAGPGSRGQPLGTALARAVARAAGPVPTPARPVLSLATPVLLGGWAAGLVLEVPRGLPGLDPALVRMQEFPPEPERFVGRAQAMARASTILAPGSGRAGVLLHGMAGSGKTASALELAYRHQDSFAAAAFWQAPLADDEFGGALASLAAQLEVQLGEFGFTMSDKITTIESLAQFSPRLRRLLEEAGILLLLDNLETLLTPAGTWRDPRWEVLMAALTGHGGESRVILTSRTPPAGLGDSVLALPVHALDLAESVALARELPGLRGLLHADAGPVRDPGEAAMAADRDLVRRVLHVVQGHPKLMELADAATADPARLTAQLDAAETVAGGQVLDVFFRDGTTALDAGQFLDALAAWTTTTLDQLSGPARLMAQFLACLEEDDRQSWIIDVNWPDLWHRLSQPGDSPDPTPFLGTLTAIALIQPGPLPGQDRDSPAPVTYRMHPGIAQAIRATASGVQAASDTELAATWQQVSDDARQQEGGEAGQAIIRAGLAAVPYLLRLQKWETAGTLLERALIRDGSPATIQAALPALRALADATHEPGALRRLANRLVGIDPAEAETLLRAALAKATADENFSLAAIAAGDLSNLLRDMGRLREALDLTSQMAQYTRRAVLGPWSQLADQAQQLQILGLMGQHRQVLGQIQALRDQMGKLPAIRAGNETIEPWNVRETILNIGYDSALSLGEWQQCLELNAASLASKEARGASAYEIVSFRYNNAGPLIELGRMADAERILLETQKTYEDQNDITGLQKVLTGRATLENRRGRPQQALELQRTAVRLVYVRPEPRYIAINHYQLANRLRAAGADFAETRAHRLAAALLFQLTGMTREVADTIRVLARELRGDADRGDLPGTIDEVVLVAGQTEGVHLDQLITALQPDRQAVADALAEILRAAADTDPRQDPAIRDRLQQWEPVIAATVAAAAGNSDAAAQITPVLDQMAQDSDWAALAAVLRRIIGGDRDASLPEGLDPADTAITGQILARLAQPPDTPAQEDP
jgi:tetratricopeptide (TPR) repeat protein